MRGCVRSRPFLTSILLELIFTIVSVLADSTEKVRYSQYPEYCSTPQQLEERRIPLPSIPSQTKKSTNTLVHVTVVSRHGTRAPKGKHECWPSFYAEGTDTAKWDCSLTYRTSLSFPPAVDSTYPEELPLHFESIYDGISPGNGSSTSSNKNILNGTCQVAQLLRMGFQQHLWNGRMLRETYFYLPTDETIHQTSNIISNPTAAPPPGRTILQFVSASLDHPSAYLTVRSDDTPRTMLSAQALLIGMLNDVTAWRNENATDSTTRVIPIHTADKDRDVLSDNDDLCPKLKDLEHDAYHAKDFKKLEKKYKLKETKHWMKDQFGYALDHPLQCLMSAICCDLSLPESLNDFGSHNSKFEELTQYELTRKNFVYSYDHAAYAKLSMGPLWRDVLDDIRLCQWQSNLSTTARNAPRLALYSGHDSTISQLLASLGTKVWKETDSVAYASLLVLEVYESHHRDSDDTDYMFRLLLNGNVLTKAIKHCHSDVCDFQVLEKHLNEFATDRRHCQRKSKKKPEKNEVVIPGVGEAVEATSPPISLDLYNPYSIWFRCLLVIAGFAMGSRLTWQHLHYTNIVTGPIF